MKKLFPAFVLSISLVGQIQAVILFDTGDPSVNTTAPAGVLANSGWQYEGAWGGYLGTPISPNFFISAAHIGQGGTVLNFQNTSYVPVASFSRPGSDLLIWKTAGTFADFAPLYTKRAEVGQHLVVIGCGTQRGAEVMRDGQLRGWYWGGNAGVRRWGENDVAEIVPFSGHDLLYATFDQHVIPNDHPNEAHLSSGDSGGSVFLNDGGVWKIAGINYAVDGPFWPVAPPENQSPDLTKFDGALFDSTGFYYADDNNPGNYIQVPGPCPQPTGFYASRISSELAWICSVIADPQIGYGSSPTITYWRLIAPSTEIGYEVEQSSDLAGWSTATTQDQTLSTTGDLDQIKGTVDPMGADHLFFRVKVTRP